MTHDLVLERDLDELMERGFAALVPQFEEVERGVSEWGDLGYCHRFQSQWVVEYFDRDIQDALILNLRK